MGFNVRCGEIQMRPIQSSCVFVILYIINAAREIFSSPKKIPSESRRLFLKALLYW